MARVVGFEPNPSGQQPVDNSGNPIPVGIWGDSDTGVGVFATSISATLPSVLGRGTGQGPASVGVRGESSSSTGVHGEGFTGVLGHSFTGIGVEGATENSNSAAVRGDNTGSDASNGTAGAAVQGRTLISDHAILGEHVGTGVGVHGTTNGVVNEGREHLPVGRIGVLGESGGIAPDFARPAGVYGFSPVDFGMRGATNTGVGVIGEAFGEAAGAGAEGVAISGVNFTAGDDVSGVSEGGIGVSGVSEGGIGVSGQGRIGVGGTATEGTGGSFSNSSDNAPALCGLNTGSSSGLTAVSNTGTALVAFGAHGGTFLGGIGIVGTLSATDKQFVIDHPLDPANKSLAHASVESSERANVYTGNVVLDENGERWVLLPEWVEALNEDFRYQLTCVGGFAQVYIAQEIPGSRFLIAGGNAGMKVSWQVFAVRKDPWAKAHPLVVEEEKSAEERGHYMSPELFGQGLEGSIHWARNRELAELVQRSHPELLQRMREQGSQPDTADG